MTIGDGEATLKAVINVDLMHAEISLVIPYLILQGLVFKEYNSIQSF